MIKNVQISVQFVLLKVDSSLYAGIHRLPFYFDFSRLIHYVTKDLVTPKFQEFSSSFTKVELSRKYFDTMMSLQMEWTAKIAQKCLPEIYKAKCFLVNS